MTSSRGAVALRIVLVMLAICVAYFALFPVVTEIPFSALHPERKAATALAVLMVVAAALPARWLEWLVPLAVSSVLTVVIAEVVVRKMAGDDFATIITLDDELLYRMVPGAHKAFRHSPANGGTTIDIRIDSLGHRAASHSPPAGASGVLVFGDSFIEAEGSPDSSTFAEQLATALSRPTSRPFASRNAGLVGYGPDQELLRLSAELRTDKPGLVVVGVYAGNDYGDLIRNRLFRLDSAGHLVRQHATLSTTLRTGFYKGRSRWILVRLISRYRNAPPPAEKDSARIANSARALIDRWLTTRTQELDDAKRRDTVVTNLFDDTPDVDVAVDSASAGSQYKFNLMAAILDSMGVVAAAQGVPIVYVLIPSAIDVLDDYDGGQVDTAKYPKYNRAAPTLALANRLRQTGRTVVDLFPVFRSSSLRPLYRVAGDNHWNTTAERLAAQTVADSIAARISGSAKRP